MKKKLDKLENLLNISTSTDIQNEYWDTQKEIDRIHEEVARGHMIRSRCKFIEEHEKPTKYFLDLEKASQNVRHIRSLKIGNEVSFDPNRILNQQKTFYRNLYTEKSVN